MRIAIVVGYRKLLGAPFHKLRTAPIFNRTILFRPVEDVADRERFDTLQSVISTQILKHDLTDLLVCQAKLDGDVRLTTAWQKMHTYLDSIPGKHTVVNPPDHVPYNPYSRDATAFVLQRIEDFLPSLSVSLEQMMDMEYRVSTAVAARIISDHVQPTTDRDVRRMCEDGELLSQHRDGRERIRLPLSSVAQFIKDHS